PYPAGAGEHLAAFSAAERSLTVFTLEAISATEVRAPWPVDVHAFLVVAVPGRPAPRTPLADEVRAGDRHVTVRVAPDLNGDTAGLQFYRAREVAGAADRARMRLLG